MPTRTNTNTCRQTDTNLIGKLLRLPRQYGDICLLLLLCRLIPLFLRRLLLLGVCFLRGWAVVGTSVDATGGSDNKTWA